MSFSVTHAGGLGVTAWAPNLRGYGNSVRPEGVQAYRVDELVEDVARLIEVSGKREVTLIAHDCGAVIAWQFALASVCRLND